MARRHSWALVALLLYCSSSLSSEADTIYATSNNAANAGLNWVMSNVLPQAAGLQVNNVVYRYTTEKITEDDMLVHVQNENAQGDGYIFRASDDWSGVPGNTISRAIPVGSIPLNFWGDGSIEVEGFGTVLEPEVYYTYQYLPCNSPQDNPSCEGYIDPLSLIPEQEIDTSSEEYIQAELDRKSNLKAQQEEEEKEARDKMAKSMEKKVRESLEDMLGLSLGAGLQKEQDTLLHNALIASNYLPQSYLVVINGGEYPDAEPLKDSKLPDSKKGLRVGLASELKHQQLVDLQYEK